MDRYEVMATLLVLAIPFAVIGLAVVSLAWARDAIARSSTSGRVGVACTLVAAGNLFVARSCDDMVNRPIITLAMGSGDCYKSGLVAIELVFLLAVATSAVVRLGEVRP